MVHRTRCWLRLLLQAPAVPACRCRGIGAGALPGCACMAAMALPGPGEPCQHYSMPLRRIWLAAISITLMMKAMAKAQMRLLRTHVWRFCFWACTAGTRGVVRHSRACAPPCSSSGTLLSPLPAGTFHQPSRISKPAHPILPNPSGTPLPHHGF